jgi:hypothetical protein
MLLEQHRLGACENRVLRRIFGPKRDEVMEQWRKVAQWGASYFVLTTSYYQADQIKANEVCGPCGTHERGEKRVQGFGGKAQRKNLL